MKVSAPPPVGDNYTYDPLKRGVEGSLGVLGHESYGERIMDCTNY
jgi:hypothetical protein